MFTKIADALNLTVSELLALPLADVNIVDVSADVAFVYVDGWRRSESGVPVRNTAPAIRFEASFSDPIKIGEETSPLHQIAVVVSDSTNKSSLAEKYAVDFRVAVCQLKRIKGATVGDVAKLIDAVSRAVENAGSRYDKTVTNTGYAVIRAAAQR